MSRVQGTCRDPAKKARDEPTEEDGIRATRRTHTKEAWPCVHEGRLQVKATLLMQIAASCPRAVSS